MITYTKERLPELKSKIQALKIELNELQRQHHHLAGRDFVISGPKRPPQYKIVWEEEG